MLPGRGGGRVVFQKGEKVRKKGKGKKRRAPPDSTGVGPRCARKVTFPPRGQDEGAEPKGNHMRSTKGGRERACNLRRDTPLQGGGSLSLPERRNENSAGKGLSLRCRPRSFDIRRLRSGNDKAICPRKVNRNRRNGYEMERKSRDADNF